MLDQEFVQLVNSSESKSEICRKIGKPINGTSLRYVTDKINELKIDISHFATAKDRGVKARKHLHTNKDCPVCGKSFEVVIGATREKKTCSYSCSNTLFRKGIRNGRFEHGGYALDEEGIRGTDSTYRSVCFQHYEKKCLICGWDISVDVHHIDENHDNNDPKNLVPLCPNHHRMIHLKEYKDQILLEIKQKMPGVPRSCL